MTYFRRTTAKESTRDLSRYEDSLAFANEMRRPLTSSEQAEIDANPFLKACDKAFAFKRIAKENAKNATDAFVKRVWNLVAKISESAGIAALDENQFALDLNRRAVRRALAIINR